MFKRVRFGFVLTEEEKCALTGLAEAEGGLSEAATLRRLIRRAAKEQGMGLRAIPRGSRDSKGLQGRGEQAAG